MGCAGRFGASEHVRHHDVDRCEEARYEVTVRRVKYGLRRSGLKSKFGKITWTRVMTHGTKSPSGEFNTTRVGRVLEARMGRVRGRG